LHKPTQPENEVERSGGTKKQVELTGERVQSAGQSVVAAAGRQRIMAITRTIRGIDEPIPVRTKRISGTRLTSE
jgi:hypothetical protein